MPSWILLHTHSVMALIIGSTQWGMLWFLLKSKNNIPVRKWITLNYLASTIWYIDQMIRFSLYPGTEGSIFYKLETVLIYSPALGLLMLANLHTYYLFIENTFERARERLLRSTLLILSIFVAANAWNEFFNHSDVKTFQIISFLWGMITNIWTLIIAVRKYRIFKNTNQDAANAMFGLALVAFCFMFLSLVNAKAGLYSSFGYWTFFIFLITGSLILIVTYFTYSSIFVSFQLKIAGYSFVAVSIFIGVATLVFFPPLEPTDITNRINQQKGLQDIFILLLIIIASIILILPVLLKRTLTLPLQKLYEAVEEVNQGNYLVAVPVIYSDEIGLLTENFNQMTRTLRQTNEQLIEYTQTLSELYANQQKIQEQTLNHISQEIHDNVGQMLSLVRVQLNLAAQKENKENKIISDAQENIGRAMRDLRDLAKGMSSERIKLLGLYASVEQEVERIRRTGICIVQINCGGNLRAMDHQREIILFRVLQECLQNVLKHSEAKQLDILFLYTDNSLSIQIKDDGKGFMMKPSNASHGLGLMNIRNRIQLMGGQIELETAPGAGTTIRIEVPLDE